MSPPADSVAVEHAANRNGLLNHEDCVVFGLGRTIPDGNRPAPKSRRSARLAIPGRLPPLPGSQPPELSPRPQVREVPGGRKSSSSVATLCPRYLRSVGNRVLASPELVFPPPLLDAWW